MTTFIQRLAVGITLSALLLPSVTFAAQTTTMTAAYRASLEQLLSLLEQELAAILAQQATTTQTSPPVATSAASTANTTISVNFIPQTPEAFMNMHGYDAGYDYISNMEMDVTAQNRPAYIPLSTATTTGNGISYYVTPANPNLKVNVTLQCNTGGLLMNSGAAEFCMIQPGNTAHMNALFDFTASSTSEHDYIFGVTSLNYTDNLANATLYQYEPQTIVTTKPNL